MTKSWAQPATSWQIHAQVAMVTGMGKKEPLGACREWCIYCKEAAPAEDPLNHCHLWPSTTLLLRPRFSLHIVSLDSTWYSHLVCTYVKCLELTALLHAVYKPQYMPFSIGIYRKLSPLRDYREKQCKLTDSLQGVWPVDPRWRVIATHREKYNRIILF